MKLSSDISFTHRALLLFFTNGLQYKHFQITTGKQIKHQSLKFKATTGTQYMYLYVVYIVTL
uniref:Uncharacterized protein n=1 Tax=Anguilla anguilla TaxID=7936 RepID=A0A0E9PFP4_ANGAN